MSEALVPRIPGVPGRAEVRLWEAFPEGAVVECAFEADPAARTVRAEVIAVLLRGGHGSAAPGRVPALRLRGAVVVGPLDLGGGGVIAELGAVTFEECAFTHPVSCDDAVLPGLSLTACRLPALAAARVRMQGPLVVWCCEVPGGVRLERARAETDVVFAGSVLGPGSDGAALAAEGLTVGGALDLDGGRRATGALRLDGVRVGGRLRLDDATVSAPGTDALVLDRSVLGDRLLGRRLVVDGAVRLFNADIAGSVQLSGARLTHPTGTALGAAGASVRGGFWCADGFTAIGEVRLTGAELRTNLSLSGARLDHPGQGTALRLDRLTASDVDARGLTVARGAVSAVGMHVRDTLDLRESRLDALDLTHARVGVLLDDPGSWPVRLGLDGLTYEALRPVLPARQRLEWLARDPSGRATHPHEQLAGHYVREGRPADGRRVRYEAQRRRRRTLPRAARGREAVLEVAVGYGFRPWRALGWLLALVALGTVVFGSVEPTALDPGKTPRFHPAAYTLDLLLPLVDLGQEAAFQPSGGTQWLAYALVGVGWVLASTVALGVGRSLSRS